MTSRATALTAARNTNDPVSASATSTSVVNQIEMYGVR